MKGNRWRCDSCGYEFDQDYAPGSCPNCGGYYFSKIGYSNGSSGSGMGFWWGLWFAFWVFFLTHFFRFCRWVWNTVKRMALGHGKD